MLLQRKQLQVLQALSKESLGKFSFNLKDQMKHFVDSGNDRRNSNFENFRSISFSLKNIIYDCHLTPLGTF